MKRNKHVVFERILQSDLESNHMVEKSKYVITVRSIWCSSHTEIELRLEERHYFLIACRPRTMCLVDNYIVKIARVEFVQMGRN